MGNDLQKMEDNLKKNGKRPKKKDGRKPKKMEDDLKKIKKIFSRFLSNLGATLSWGWLSSLRFLYTFITNIQMVPRLQTRPDTVLNKSMKVS